MPNFRYYASAPHPSNSRYLNPLATRQVGQNCGCIKSSVSIDVYIKCAMPILAPCSVFIGGGMLMKDLFREDYTIYA